MMRYREAELKHGRVAMIAVLGYLSSENWHPFYDGKLSDNPLQALWDMPPAGAVQIIAFIGLLEYTFDAVAKESGNPVGDFYGISNRISDKDAPAWVDFQTRELNNGRLAMFGIMGELAHSAINGVPLLAPCPQMVTTVFGIYPLPQETNIRLNVFVYLAAGRVLGN